MKRAGPAKGELAITGLLILLILCLSYLAGYALSALVGHPSYLQFLVEVRVLGLVILVGGLLTGADVFRYRNLGDVATSTSATVMKLIRGRPLDEVGGRTEPFVPRGPYAYTRSPMYFGVVAILLGAGLALSSLPLLFWGVVLACFYWFLLIPFEERELQALFGQSFADYRRQVPKLFPYGRRYKPSALVNS